MSDRAEMESEGPPRAPVILPAEISRSPSPLSLDVASTTTFVSAAYVRHFQAALFSSLIRQLHNSSGTVPAPAVVKTSQTDSYERDRSRRSRAPSPEDRPEMAEPPAKRAKRTDSSAMWDRNDSRTDGRSQKDQDSRRGGGRDQGKKAHRPDDRKDRSRSPERNDRRRDRSRSKDRARGGRDGADRFVRDRDRDRDTSRDRHRSRRDPPSRPARHRSRSRSPKRNDTRKPQIDRPTTSSKPPLPVNAVSKTTSAQTSSKPLTNTAANGNSKGSTEKMDIVNDDEDEETAAERAMQQVMGFGKFKSTKNTKVPGNNIYACRKEKKTEYRQYMNRVGGFNRPLSPSRD